MILVVYTQTGHGIFHPVVEVFCFLQKPVFGLRRTRLNLPQRGKYKEKSGAPLSEHASCDERGSLYERLPNIIGTSVVF